MNTGAWSDPLLALLTALEQALMAETDALCTRDVDALAQAVESKRQTLTALGRLQPIGPDGDRGGTAAAELLGRCRALNEIAGSAIATLRQDTRHALSLLGIENEAPGYGAPGRPVRAGRALAVC